MNEPSSERAAAHGQREIRYEHSPKFLPLLAQAGCSLLVTTYQADRLVTIGAHAGQLVIGFHAFEQPMGLAVGSQQLAIGTRGQAWLLRATPGIASQLEPSGRYDACFLARTAYVTGEINVHELAWGGSQSGIEDLWLVNTLFSCLCHVDGRHSFVPRWRPPFISALAAEDRCHLNGIAMERGRPRYATVLAVSDTPAGWRPAKATAGSIIDVDTGAVLIGGLAMPHSPRLYAGRLWVLESGRGRLLAAEPHSGRTEVVCELPGYARGLAFHGPLAIVGLSKARETAVFGGLPLEERREQLKCGVGFIEVASGRYLGHLEFVKGIDEIFDVQVLPTSRCPAVFGPLTAVDQTEAIWVVPQPST